ncbi:MAG: hypothetical protein C4570_02450 [Ammonifex sp.]|nr:MAG: hypothetical protein C4570_02450 [Ammonifex sp.]
MGQILFTIPVALAGWVLLGLVICFIASKRFTASGFKDILSVLGFSLYVPCLLVKWIPETSVAFFLSRCLGGWSADQSFLEVVSGHLRLGGLCLGVRFYCIRRPESGKCLLVEKRYCRFSGDLYHNVFLCSFLALDDMVQGALRRDCA